MGGNSDFGLALHCTTKNAKLPPSLVQAWRKFQFFVAVTFFWDNDSCVFWVSSCGFFVGRVCRQYRNDWTPIGCGQLGWTQWQVVSHLRPLSFFSVPPYFGLVPIKSIISGMQLANIAFGPSTTGHTGIHARSSSLFIWM